MILNLSGLDDARTCLVSNIHAKKLLRSKISQLFPLQFIRRYARIKRQTKAPSFDPDVLFTQIEH